MESRPLQPSSPTSGLTPPKVLASAADGVVDLIERESGDVESIFGRSGVRLDDLGSPVNELVLSQFCNLFEIAAGETGNGNFGLDFGDDFKPRQLGPIGYAAITSPTLSAALSNLIRYFPAHQGQSTLCIIPDKDVLWLSYRIDDPRIVNRRQDAELSPVHVSQYLPRGAWSGLATARGQVRTCEAG